MVVVDDLRAEPHIEREPRVGQHGDAFRGSPLVPFVSGLDVFETHFDRAVALIGVEEELSFALTVVVFLGDEEVRVGMLFAFAVNVGVRNVHIHSEDDIEVFTGICRDVQAQLIACVGGPVVAVDEAGDVLAAAGGIFRNNGAVVRGALIPAVILFTEFADDAAFNDGGGGEVREVGLIHHITFFGRAALDGQIDIDGGLAGDVARDSDDRAIEAEAHFLAVDSNGQSETTLYSVSLARDADIFGAFHDLGEEIKTVAAVVANDDIGALCGIGDRIAGHHNAYLRIGVGLLDGFDTEVVDQIRIVVGVDIETELVEVSVFAGDGVDPFVSIVSGIAEGYGEELAIERI